MKIVILGMGISGQAVATYCQKRGIVHTCLDQKLGSTSFPDADLAVLSPGLLMDHPWILEAQRRGIPCTTEIELALPHLEGKRIVGITGSNGKTTTTLLTTHICNQSGIKTLAVGNVGRPLLSAIDEDVDLFVLELSSFQLEKTEERLFLDAALILNITPNHLDHHASFEEYERAKRRIERCTTNLLFFREHEKQFPLPAHERENHAAAYSICRFVGLRHEKILAAMETFERLAHRQQVLGSKGGVLFVNDSKATSVEAMMRALHTFEGPLHLIVGGMDKGGDFSALQEVAHKLKGVYAMGEAAGRIKSCFSAAQCVSTLDEAVKKAHAVAQKGDTLLLSPGCSSYDQFENFEKRGEAFCAYFEEEG